MIFGLLWGYSCCWYSFVGLAAIQYPFKARPHTYTDPDWVAVTVFGNLWGDDGCGIGFWLVPWLTWVRLDGVPLRLSRLFLGRPPTKATKYKGWNYSLSLYVSIVKKNLFGKGIVCLGIALTSTGWKRFPLNILSCDPLRQISRFLFLQHFHLISFIPSRI